MSRDYGFMEHAPGPDCGYNVEAFSGPELVTESTVRTEDQSEELAQHYLTSSRADRVIVTDGDTHQIVAVW